MEHVLSYNVSDSLKYYIHFGNCLEDSYKSKYTFACCSQFCYLYLLRWEGEHLFKNNIAPVIIIAKN